MSEPSSGDISFHARRFFATTSGVKLPLRLVSEIAVEAIKNRNTYFVAFFDASDRLLGFDKMVYGECVSTHRYDYARSGALSRAVILAEGEDETREVLFDDDGRPLV
jgi:hypothetical protein